MLTARPNRQHKYALPNLSFRAAQWREILFKGWKDFSRWLERTGSGKICPVEKPYVRKSFLAIVSLGYAWQHRPMAGDTFGCG